MHLLNKPKAISSLECLYYRKWESFPIRNRKLFVAHYQDIAIEPAQNYVKRQLCGVSLLNWITTTVKHWNILPKIIVMMPFYLPHTAAPLDILLSSHKLGAHYALILSPPNLDKKGIIVSEYDEWT